MIDSNMNNIVDEVLYLYFEGYYLNEILNGIKDNQKKRMKAKKIATKHKPAPITQNQCIDLGIVKSKYPKSFTKLDIKEHEAIQFNKVLSENLDLVPGVKYKILEPKGKGLKICFIGEFKEQGAKYIRLIHKHGYSETFLKSDLLSGEYLIREA